MKIRPIYNYDDDDIDNFNYKNFIKQFTDVMKTSFNEIDEILSWNNFNNILSKFERISGKGYLIIGKDTRKENKNSIFIETTSRNYKQRMKDSDRKNRKLFVVLESNDHKLLEKLIHKTFVKIQKKVPGVKRKFEKEWFDLTKYDFIQQKELLIEIILIIKQFSYMINFLTSIHKHLLNKL